MSSALISSADASRIAIPAEDEDVAALRASVVAKLTYHVGRDPIVATDWDWFMAAALAVRDHVLERWLASTRTNYISKGKRVYYLSLEFLIGRLLHDSLNNLGLVGSDARSTGRTRGRLRPVAQHRARRGAGQRRARPAGRLLHGEHGDAVHRRRTATASATTTACSAR